MHSQRSFGPSASIEPDVFGWLGGAQNPGCDALHSSTSGSMLSDAVNIYRIGHFLTKFGAFSCRASRFADLLATLGAKGPRDDQRTGRASPSMP